MKGNREKRLPEGMDGYLTKPIRPRELDEVLQCFLERRRKCGSPGEHTEQEKRVETALQQVVPLAIREPVHQGAEGVKLL